jgi:putative N-acetyltransferase (TIGR04045 family)
MLDASVWGEPVAPFLSSHVTAQIASEPWEHVAYLDLRRAIFVAEQRMFEVSDVDAYDSIATPIVVLGHSGGMPDEVIGGVRIYSTDGSTWFGGRLGVHPRYRARGVVGSALIFAAVSTAHAWGCTRFLATVQEANVRYFERHRFASVSTIDVCGHPHRLMEADLGCFPPRVAHPLAPVDGSRMAAVLADFGRRHAA